MVNDLQDELHGWVTEKTAMLRDIDTAVDTHMKRFSAKEREDTKAKLAEAIDDAFFDVIDALQADILERERHQRLRELAADKRDYERRTL